jgi:hypothetical protein
MYRYVGFRCPVTDCGAFIVWKELPPGESAPPQVQALQWITGTCPKCKREYSVSVELLVEIESENPAKFAVVSE